MIKVDDMVRQLGSFERTLCFMFGARKDWSEHRNYTFATLSLIRVWKNEDKTEMPIVRKILSVCFHHPINYIRAEAIVLMLELGVKMLEDEIESILNPGLLEELQSHRIFIEVARKEHVHTIRFFEGLRLWLDKSPALVRFLFFLAARESGVPIAEKILLSSEYVFSREFWYEHGVYVLKPNPLLPLPTKFKYLNSIGKEAIVVDALMERLKDGDPFKLSTYECFQVFFDSPRKEFFTWSVSIQRKMERKEIFLKKCEQVRNLTGHRSLGEEIYRTIRYFWNILSKNEKSCLLKFMPNRRRNYKHSP